MGALTRTGCIAIGLLGFAGSAVGQIISVAAASTLYVEDYQVFAQTFQTPVGYNTLSSLVLPAYNIPTPYPLPGGVPAGAYGSERVEIAQWDPIGKHFTGSALWSGYLSPTNTSADGLQNYTFTFGSGLTLNPSLIYAIGVRQSFGYIALGSGATALSGQSLYAGMYDWNVSEFTSPGSNGWNSFGSAGGYAPSMAFTETFTNGLTPVPEPAMPGVVIGLAAVTGLWQLRRRVGCVAV